MGGSGTLLAMGLARRVAETARISDNMVRRTISLILTSEWDDRSLIVCRKFSRLSRGAIGRRRKCKVGKWLLQRQAIPRWWIICITLMIIASHIFVQMKAHEFHIRKAWVEHELAELTCDQSESFPKLCIIDYLAPPFIATIGGSPEMRAGLLFAFSAVTGLVWFVFRRNQ